VTVSQAAAPSYGRLAEIVGGKAAANAPRFASQLELGFGAGGERLVRETTEIASLLAVAYPAMAPFVDANPEEILALARGGIRAAREARFYRRAAASIARGADWGALKQGLRVLARREKLRIALRELYPQPGCDVDVTAQELSDLAEACIGVALDEALAWAEGRFGVPVSADGSRCPVVVLGMGKLGGRELNAGSDVDLIVFYGTDDGRVVKGGNLAEVSLHEHFTRVTQRFIATLDDVTEHGRVWPVDMRLRPEGSRGALVNSLSAAESYYETWGRTWERVAFVRARPVAGDAAFGRELLEALSPFVWRRAVAPRLGDELIALVARARVELAMDPSRDLKLGVGGIREAEFFVQALQLVWGGRDARLRSPNTLAALRRLKARGFVTDREEREIEAAYLFLRKLEHRVQFATGLQTHALPTGELLDRIARSLGFEGAPGLERTLSQTRDQVHRALMSLWQGDVGQGFPQVVTSTRAGSPSSIAGLFAALDAGDEGPVLARLEELFGAQVSPDLARHMLALARRPDAPLGGATRDRLPHFSAELVRSISETADPEQAGRFLARFFSRLAIPSVYARALADDPHHLRRMTNLFGASSFLGEVIVGHPELSDEILFRRGLPGVGDAERAVDEEVLALSKEEAKEPNAFVGALRRAKRRVLLEVGFADLSEELGTRECTQILSALADATIDRATQFAMQERGAEGERLAVIAMGKLGGREIGYGSDLDIVFVYDEPEGAMIDGGEHHARTAQRVLRLLGTPHGEGPGYELDTRLRPSGNHGLLVVSLDAFARYHGLHSDCDEVTVQGRDWERQSLVKARPCGGNAQLGDAFVALAEAAAYERGAPPIQEINRLRTRMERELGGERRTPGRLRYDLKVGRGGLVDVEFAVQWLQMKHGKDPRVRTPETESALAALEGCGYIDASVATPLREGYAFLRKLEQRLRVLHGAGAQLIEDGAPGLPPLARRMGMRDEPRMSAESALLTRYREVTEDVRAAYLAVLGLEDSA
jgi:[glutamine synthetase] adenylyltransferase / [glutamine synthetase]-adenylyl-L-tyrosine phosphorylase